MAKGLRSSVKKSNRSKLRARVFGPVEAARNERLHAKLLEAVQAPKPDPPKKSEMEVDSADSAEGESSPHPLRTLPFSSTTTTTSSSITSTTAAAGVGAAATVTADTITDTHTDADANIEKADALKGLFPVSVRIPKYLTTSGDDTSSVRCAREARIERSFYLSLGLSSDIMGFPTPNRLALGFDHF